MLFRKNSLSGHIEGVRELPDNEPVERCHGERRGKTDPRTVEDDPRSFEGRVAEEVAQDEATAHGVSQNEQG